MKIEEIENKKLKRGYKISISKDELDKKLEKKINDVKGEIHLKGFRPGKAPVSFLKKFYGKRFMGEVIEKEMKEATDKLLSEKELKPASQPVIDLLGDADDVIVGKKDLEYSVNLEIIPEFEIKDYKSLEIEKPVYAVSDKDVDEAFDNFISNYVTYEKAEKKGENKDQLLIDFVGKIDGKEFEGGKADNIELVLGSKNFIEGFEENLLGLKAGDEKEFEVTFPENYKSDLASKKAVFSVKVNEVRKQVLPKMDKEFFGKLKVKDEKEIRDMLKSQLESHFAQRSRVHVKRAILDKLDEQYDFELPEQLVEQEFNNIWEQVKSSPREESDKDKSDEELQKEYKDIAIRRVRLGLVLAQIGKEENVTVNKDELRNAIATQARQMPGREKEIFDFYNKNPQALTSLSAPIFEEKSVDKVIEAVKTKEKKVTKEFILEDPEE